jgi:hypothetical protein
MVPAPVPSRFESSNDRRQEAGPFESQKSEAARKMEKKSKYFYTYT